MLINLDQDPAFSARLGVASALTKAHSSRELASRNGLLRALPADALARLHPLLTRVELKRRQVLHECNVPLTHAYFIEQGTVCLRLRLARRGFLEVGLLGHSDFVGLPLFLGTQRSPHRSVVQAPGHAFKISAGDLGRALEDLPALREILLAYAQATIIEAMQMAACNSCHNLKERLARYLLAAHDRINSHEIPLTHQILSRALGVRRASVTTTIGRLQAAGLLHQGRGRLQITDPPGLEAVACECYRVIRSEYRRTVCTAGEHAQPYFHHDPAFKPLVAS